MAANYIPTRESELVTWSTNFKNQIATKFASYGLTDVQAGAYGELHDLFVAAHDKANDPLTRSPANIQAKDARKKNLILEARRLAMVVQNVPYMTNEKRSELRLTLREDEPTPVPPPGEPPSIDVVSVVGRTVKIRLHDGSSTRRRKPVGVSGATVLSYVGDEPPADLGTWRLEGNTGRTTYDIAFPTTVPAGAKVWITAFWFNPRKQSGPSATPATAYIQYGGLSQAA